MQVERGKFCSPGRWNWNGEVKVIKRCGVMELNVHGGPGLQTPSVMGRLNCRVQKQRALRVEGRLECGDLLLNPNWPHLHPIPPPWFNVLHSIITGWEFLTRLFVTGLFPLTHQLHVSCLSCLLGAQQVPNKYLLTELRNE